MPKVRPLIQRGREAQAIENEIQRTSRDFPTIIGERRGRDDIDRGEMAEFIGTSRSAFYHWRNGGLSGAKFGQVITASRKLGYRVVFEPIVRK